MAKAKKELDTEVNLVSFISLLSVLICSLLLTAIWIQIGTLDVKQAVGGQAQQKQKKKDPILWAQFQKNGAISFRLQDAPRVKRKLRRHTVAGLEGKWNKDEVIKHIEVIQAQIPQLKTVLIQPRTKTLYEDVITLMDAFKEKGLTELGVSPL